MLALLGLWGCHATDGACCSNDDCPGNYICNVDCSGTDDTKGICLAPCQVDRDCGLGSVCNLYILSCGCEAVSDSADGGTVGTCAGGVGH
jgi:hypothetical protein